MRTTEIATGTGIHGTTTLRTLQDLAIITLLRGRVVEDEQGKPNEWLITDKALTLIGGSEIFSDLEDDV